MPALRASGKLQVVRMQAQIFVAHVERIAAVMRRRLEAGNIIRKASPSLTRQL